MRVAIVIPSRFASTRLSGKPLLRATGKYLVQHVYDRASLAKSAAQVIVATDDTRIAAAVRGFGGRVVMTNPEHPSGTDRVAEVAEGLDADVILNVQGDEPLIDPAALDQLAAVMDQSPGSDAATLGVPITDNETYLSPNVVKVVCDDRGRALYFSRSPIPYFRDREPDFQSQTLRVMQHVGVYAYRKEALLRISRTPPHWLEIAEKLEQLRILATGGSIAVGMIAHAHRGVDTPADYEHFVQEYRMGQMRLAG